MLKYTIAFLKRGDEILLLNREKPYWMGCWNGVGGKLLPNESPLDCVLREIKEETGIKLETIHYKGTVTWNVGSFDGGGMYLYLADLPANFSYSTPTKTDEGILDWKKLIGFLTPKIKELPIFITFSLPCFMIIKLMSIGLFMKGIWLRHLPRFLRIWRFVIPIRCR